MLICRQQEQVFGQKVKMIRAVVKEVSCGSREGHESEAGGH